MKSDSLLNSPTSKIMGVLREVAHMGSASLSILASNLNLPAPTVHRIATELERLGYLQRYPGNRNWHVGLGLVELSGAAMAAGVSLSRIKEIVQNLATETGETITFGTLAGSNVSYVLSIDLPLPQTLSFRAGRHAPLYCTSSGRLFLARMDPRDLATYFAQTRFTAYTRFTETDPKAIEKIVKKVRRQGFAITLQEYVDHVNGAAVPVIDQSGTMLGTLGISVPEYRGPASRLRTIVPRLQACAQEIANCLSGHGFRSGEAY
jgi:DNA-binding IclR family transcriptional regulator